MSLKVDMHIHTSGVSRCAIADYKEVIDYKKKQGYDILVLTNHIQKWYGDVSQYNELITGHIKEYEKMKEYGEAHGIKVIFSVEVTIHDPDIADFLLYGITPTQLREFPVLYLLKQKELYELCKKNDTLMIQAHPFRIKYGHHLMNFSYMDGIELNLNTDLPYFDKIVEICKENHLILTCGTDYHGNISYFGGQLINKEISNEKELYDYLKNSKHYSIFLYQKEFLI